jgi:trehalose synthase
MTKVQERVAQAEALGLAAEDLDLLVHDCAQDAGRAGLNALEDPIDQEDHVGAAEEAASAVNNAGLESQAEYLLEHNGKDKVRQLLDEAAARRLSLAAAVRPGDVIILHDPQTAGMVHALKRRGALVVWRSHIGTERPNALVEAAWALLLPHVQAADARVFSRYAYVPPAQRSLPAGVIAPSIDPLSPKNQPMALPVVHAVLHRAGLVGGPAPAAEAVFRRGNRTVGRVTRACQVIREGGPPGPDTPLVVQVSRWDRLKDPAGVLLGFAAQTSGRSAAHLILAGPVVEGVADDPEGAQTVAAWRRLPSAARRRVHLACLPMDDLEENAAVVNALQRHAAVVVQKSLREGFGLTVTEARWKGRPVVASKLGGVRKQIENGVSGLLLEDPSDLAAFAALVGRVLQEAALARRLGAAAYRRVRQRFLHTHHLCMWVTFLAHLLGPRQAAWPDLDSSAVLSARVG